MVTIAAFFVNAQVGLTWHDNDNKAGVQARGPAQSVTKEVLNGHDGVVLEMEKFKYMMDTIGSDTIIAPKFLCLDSL